MFAAYTETSNERGRSRHFGRKKQKRMKWSHSTLSNNTKVSSTKPEHTQIAGAHMKGVGRPDICKVELVCRALSPAAMLPNLL
jgi:hypothetical protein